MATVKELKAELKALGVDAPEGAKKADLQALLARSSTAGPGSNVADLGQPDANAGAGV